MSHAPSNQTILIVDDEPINIKALQLVLGDEHNLVFATTGEMALEMAAQDPQPDLILMDIVMPGMDGFEVCERLKKDDRTRNIPVVFLTARWETSEEAKGLELGAVDYIRKPFSPPIIKARIRNHLELKKTRDLLENLSTLDGLTNIPNRRRFDEIFAHEWNRAVRNKSPLSLLFIDIDHFKNYNDCYGHLAGDDCLKAVARILQSSLGRAADFLARFGGGGVHHPAPGHARERLPSSGRSHPRGRGKAGHRTQGLARGGPHHRVHRRGDMRRRHGLRPRHAPRTRRQAALPGQARRPEPGHVADRARRVMNTGPQEAPSPRRTGWN